MLRGLEEVHTEPPLKVPAGDGSGHGLPRRNRPEATAERPTPISRQREPGATTPRRVQATRRRWQKQNSDSGIFHPWSEAYRVGNPSPKKEHPLHSICGEVSWIRAHRAKLGRRASWSRQFHPSLCTGAVGRAPGSGGRTPSASRLPRVRCPGIARRQSSPGWAQSGGRLPSSSTSRAQGRR